MSKSLDDKIYLDREIRCKNCHKSIGHQKLDGQILVVGELIIFNYFCWQCSCGRNDSWLSPLLPDELPTLENLNPDIKELEKAAKKGITRLAHNRFRVRYRSADGKEKYLGVYPSEAEAVKARDAAVSVETAKKLGYKPKSTKQADDFQYQY